MMRLDLEGVATLQESWLQIAISVKQLERLFKRLFGYAWLCLTQRVYVSRVARMFDDRCVSPVASISCYHQHNAAAMSCTKFVLHLAASKGVSSEFHSLGQTVTKS
jgi:hypothetical protein